MSAKIKVMTFNLRIRVISDGRNYFDRRTAKIRQMIEAEQPDLIGFQEANDYMADWLTDNLTDYTVIGHGREADYRGEGMYIAYRKNRFRLHAYHQQALSLFPKKGGSRLESTDQSKYPRAYACAELILRESNSPFAFYNIHTDHKGEQARLIECALLMRDVAKSPYPFIITGDFNDYPHSSPITLVLSTAPELGTVDATKHIKGSFHGFKGEVGNCKIDYIFTNLPTNPAASYAVTDDDNCGNYYSDHHALCAIVELP